MTTSKELVIQEITERLNAKERANKLLQDEIHSLRELLEKIESTSGISCDTLLVTCEDFPLNSCDLYRLERKIGSVECDGHKYATVNDLIHFSRKEFLSIPQIGVTKANNLDNWMKKHNLVFLS